MMRPLAAPGVLEKLAADAHYNRLCHLFGGSAIIDLPLSTYRIHGENFFASTPSIAAVRQDRGPAQKFTALRIRENIRVLIAKATDLAWRIGEDRYWNSLEALLDQHEIGSEPGSEAEIIVFMTEQLAPLAAAFGEKKVVLKLAEILPLRIVRAILRQHYGPDIPARLRGVLYRLPWIRLRQRIRLTLRKRRMRRRERRARR